MFMILNGMLWLLIILKGTFGQDSEQKLIIAGSGSRRDREFPAINKHRRLL